MDRLEGFLETASLIQANHSKDENSDSGTGIRSQEEATGICAWHY